MEYVKIKKTCLSYQTTLQVHDYFTMSNNETDQK